MSFNKDFWKPGKKGEIFLSLPTSIKEASYGGGAGSGKTDLLLMYGIVHRWHENPRYKQVFMRRTFPELRNEIIPRSREIYRKFGATLNKSDMAWTFPRLDQFGGTGMTNSGAMIFLGQCEDEEDVHKYDSMEINLYSPDELTSYTEWIYLYIGFERVRTSDSTLPAIIRSAAMPGGIGHTWYKKRFVNPCKEGGKIIIGKGGNKRIYIHATLQDNIEHIDPGYAQSLEALPEAEKRAKKYGDWDAYLGQVFDEFRDKPYPDEPSNALHVIEPFEIPDWWPKIVIGDWGYRALTYIAYTAISPDRRIYIYREQHWSQTKIEVWAPYAKELIDRDNPRIVNFCQSAKQDRGQEHTIQQQISTALGRPIGLTGNTAGSRIAGKQLIHEYLRWKPKPLIPKTSPVTFNEEHAMWLLRVRGLNEYKSYLNTFSEPEPEINIPKMQIFNTCPVLTDAIKSCSYDKKKIEDIAEFAGDDPIDVLRYVTDASERFFNEAEGEFEKIQKQAALISQLNGTQDFTAFYRNSRTLEAKSKTLMVKRYHGHR